MFKIRLLVKLLLFASHVAADVFHLFLCFIVLIVFYCV